jgi:hypothetical protein
MRSLFLILIIVFTLKLAAQENNDYTEIDKKALQIPDSSTQTTSGIAKYMNTSFSDQPDKARAVFVWIINNIQYDIDNLFAVNFYQNSGEIIEKVLKTRKGICMHYAELYADIANKTGIKSYVISGYTKEWICGLYPTGISPTEDLNEIGKSPAHGINIKFLPDKQDCSFLNSSFNLTLIPSGEYCGIPLSWAGQHGPERLLNRKNSG